MDFDFSKGGEDCGMFYPPLKPVVDATRYTSGWKDHSYYHYEPGNGTRYEVVFTTIKTEYDTENETVVMAVICPRNAAMVIPEALGMHSLGYMMEKLKMLEGDCYALIPLVNHYLKESK